MSANYTEESIKSLDWKEHIRLRPGMYIGKLGDGSSSDDGIYVLLKEVVDNSVDEYVMGNGRTIEINLDDKRMSVRDYGRGIPLGKLKDCAAKINTGAKYDSEAFKKSVGLNGVGIKAVNALSMDFSIQAFRERKTRRIDFQQGEVSKEDKRDRHANASDRNGTLVEFKPDIEVFGEFKWEDSIIESMLWNYAYLNTGLTLVFNGKKFHSQNGLLDLLTDEITEEVRYPIIHLMGEDIEVAFTHGNAYGEEYFSFVNGQHTTQGGTHQGAFREAIAKTIQSFFQKNLEAVDIRSSIIAAVSVKVIEPVFESQTKTKLGSQKMAPDGQSIRNYIYQFLSKELDNYLHKNPDTAKAMLAKIQDSEKSRKEIQGIRKLARERAKKAKLHNSKLRDCRIHMDSKKVEREYSTLFITEGDSASGSITKARDVQTQAVFSLRGKPLNCFGLTKKVVYENEEFNLLQSALDIEEDLENLRYNKVVIATDADVDGMHIRLLLITFFLQFFPELIRENHLFILQTPLFRVRNKKKTHYCYDEKEKREAIAELGKQAEITRFKGLGEISPDEFRHFIGPDIRLDPVTIKKHTSIQDILRFYMGKNTQERQKFIIDNLVIEQDLIEEEKAPGKGAAA
jgi:topoisomerase-4 subunit B